MAANPHERESEQILSALAGVFRRRKTITILCLLAVLAVVHHYNQTAVPLYEASTSVVFEELRGPLPADVSTDLTRELSMFNRLEEINSRAFAEDVAAALPLEMQARLPVPEKRPPDFDRTRHIVEVIDQGVTAFPLRNSNIIRIRVRLSDPHLCVTVADLCLSILEQRSGEVRNKGVAELRDFVETQLDRSAARLQRSEHELMRFKEKHDITSLESDANEMLRKMTDAEVLYNTTIAERGAAQKRLTAIQQTIAAQRKDLVPSVTSIASPSVQKLREKLVSLEVQLAQLHVQQYARDHPQLVRLQQDIDQTKKALADEAIKLARADDVGDPVALIARRIEESVSLQIEAQGLMARSDALKQTVERYRNWLKDLPEKEMELARLVRERDVNEKVYMSLLEHREDIRISQAKQISGSRVIDRPRLPRKPVEPRKGMNLGLGAALGLALGMGWGFVLEGRSKRLGSMLQFEQKTGWSVLTLVPAIRWGPEHWKWPKRGARKEGANVRPKRPLVVLRDPDSAAGESYAILRTRLELLGMGTKHHSLLITSCGSHDGKSSTLSNLAATFAAAGRTTVVVDAEVRRPTMHAIFGVERSPGLTDLLVPRNGNGAKPRQENAPATSSPIHTGLLQETPVRGVDLLASGHHTKEAAAEMSWGQMPSVLEDLKKKYEVILVDSASPILVHDTLILCGMVDAVVVVVDARSYDAERLMESKLLLERAGANVLGAVLNKVDFGGRPGYGYTRERGHQRS